MDNLMNSLRRMGRLLIVAILVIITIGIGIYSIQQKTREGQLEENINRLSLTLAKPLPSAEKLQQQYKEVVNSLAPITPKDAVGVIISIAEESGIDVNPDSNKLRIPPQDSIGKEKVGGGTYQVISLNNIMVQGDYTTVMAFIGNLEARQKLPTLVIKMLTLSQVSTQVEIEKEVKIDVLETLATLNVAVYTRAGSATK